MFIMKVEMSWKFFRRRDQEEASGARSKGPKTRPIYKIPFSHLLRYSEVLKSFICLSMKYFEVDFEINC